MSLESDLFARLIPRYDALEGYGFKKEDQRYIYERPLMNHDFYARITIENDEVSGKVFDAFSDEEYTLIHMSHQQGAFVSQVREEYVSILEDVAKHCFKVSHFISHQARRLEKLIYNIYKCEPQYPYKGTRKEDAVFKDKNIFAIISLTDAYAKGKSEEVLSFKVKEEIYAKLLTKEGIYPTYLKNRKWWISVPLNDQIADDILLELIKYSYQITQKNHQRSTGIKEWIIPSSSDFDIDGYFSQDEVFWRQTTDIRPDDIIYVYVAKPYSCILYKCVATQTGLPNPYESTSKHKRHAMLLHPLERYDRKDYPLDLLRKYNVRYVRGPRYMPKELSDLINGR